MSSAVSRKPYNSRISVYAIQYKDDTLCGLSLCLSNFISDQVLSGRDETWRRHKMESVWMKHMEIRKREALSGDREAPVVVIGAGLAGILTAYYLEQAGIRALVLEAGRIGSGQTKNTTAKITSQHNLVYDYLIRTFGRSMAEHYARVNEEAIREYERLIGEKAIDGGSEKGSGGGEVSWHKSFFQDRL